jgi:hypothetical protein
MKSCYLHANLTSGATKASTLAKTVEVPNSQKVEREGSIMDL